MRTIFFAHLMISCRYILKAYVCHYGDSVLEWCRSITKIKVLFISD